MLLRRGGEQVCHHVGPEQRDPGHSALLLLAIADHFDQFAFVLIPECCRVQRGEPAVTADQQAFTSARTHTAYPGRRFGASPFSQAFANRARSRSTSALAAVRPSRVIAYNRRRSSAVVRPRTSSIQPCSSRRWRAPYRVPGLSFVFPPVRDATSCMML